MGGNLHCSRETIIWFVGDNFYGSRALNYLARGKYFMWFSDDTLYSSRMIIQPYVFRMAK